jgi:hypothetical protein
MGAQTDLDAEELLNLELNRQTVAVPAEVAGHMEARLVRKARPHILRRAASIHSRRVRGGGAGARGVGRGP